MRTVNPDLVKLFTDAIADGNVDVLQLARGMAAETLKPYTAQSSYLLRDDEAQWDIDLPGLFVQATLF